MATLNANAPFQHTAARRRLGFIIRTFIRLIICFNTQPPEGGWVAGRHKIAETHSFNTQPPEGGWASMPICSAMSSMFQHTAARRRLVNSMVSLYPLRRFQHTAARRRLGTTHISIITSKGVSTHSRPKAAGGSDGGGSSGKKGFNTQPPEGGWSLS